MPKFDFFFFQFDEPLKLTFSIICNYIVKYLFVWSLVWIIDISSSVNDEYFWFSLPLKKCTILFAISVKTSKPFDFHIAFDLPAWKNMERIKCNFFLYEKLFAPIYNRTAERQWNYNFPWEIIPETRRIEAEARNLAL